MSDDQSFVKSLLIPELPAYLENNREAPEIGNIVNNHENLVSILNECATFLHLDDLNEWTKGMNAKSPEDDVKERFRDEYKSLERNVKRSGELGAPGVGDFFSSWTHIQSTGQPEFVLRTRKLCLQVNDEKWKAALAPASPESYADRKKFVFDFNRICEWSKQKLLETLAASRKKMTDEYKYTREKTQFCFERMFKPPITPRYIAELELNLKDDKWKAKLPEVFKENNVSFDGDVLKATEEYITATWTIHRVLQMLVRLFNDKVVQTLFHYRKDEDGTVSATLMDDGTAEQFQKHDLSDFLMDPELPKALRESAKYNFFGVHESLKSDTHTRLDTHDIGDRKWAEKSRVRISWFEKDFVKKVDMLETEVNQLEKSHDSSVGQYISSWRHLKTPCCVLLRTRLITMQLFDSDSRNKLKTRVAERRSLAYDFNSTRELIDSAFRDVFTRCQEGWMNAYGHEKAKIYGDNVPVLTPEFIAGLNPKEGKWKQRLRQELQGKDFSTEADTVEAVAEVITATWPLVKARSVLSALFNKIKDDPDLKTGFDCKIDDGSGQLTLIARAKQQGSATPSVKRPANDDAGEGGSSDSKAKRQKETGEAKPKPKPKKGKGKEA